MEFWLRFDVCVFTRQRESHHIVAMKSGLLWLRERSYVLPQPRADNLHDNDSWADRPVAATSTQNNYFQQGLEQRGLRARPEIGIAP
jgi:hypothetical protein